MGGRERAIGWTLALGLAGGFTACGGEEKPREGAPGVGGSAGTPVASTGGLGVAGESGGPGSPGGSGGSDVDGGTVGGAAGSGGAGVSPCGQDAEVVLALDSSSAVFQPA